MIALLINCSAQNLLEVNSLEASALIDKNSKIILLDVRTEGEFSQGHIKGAVNINVHLPDAMARINKLDKNVQYLVYCRTRNRSGVVSGQMLKSGFKTVYQMTDGIVGWTRNQLPLEK